jgi:hypothetical protein
LLLHLDEVESAAVFSAAELLLGEEGESKQAVLNGLLSGHGNFQGTTCKLVPSVPLSALTLHTDAHLFEITELFLNPRRNPTPVLDQIVTTEDTAVPESLIASTVVDDPETAPVIPSGGPTGSGSFHFMQASEIDTHSFEENAEWVEKPDTEGSPHSQEVNLASPNGHADSEGSVPVTTEEVIYFSLLSKTISD